MISLATYHEVLLAAAWFLSQPINVQQSVMCLEENSFVNPTRPVNHTSHDDDVNTNISKSVDLKRYLKWLTSNVMKKCNDIQVVLQAEQPFVSDV